MIQYSIGELIDRLAITNLKIWHLEESIKEQRDAGASDEDVLELCDKVIALNALRVEIVDSINEFFDAKTE